MPNLNLGVLGSVALTQVTNKAGKQVHKPAQGDCLVITEGEFANHRVFLSIYPPAQVKQPKEAKQPRAVTAAFEALTAMGISPDLIKAALAKTQPAVK